MSLSLKFAPVAFLAALSTTAQQVGTTADKIADYTGKTQACLTNVVLSRGGVWHDKSEPTFPNFLQADHYFDPNGTKYAVVMHPTQSDREYVSIEATVEKTVDPSKGKKATTTVLRDWTNAVLVLISP